MDIGRVNRKVSWVKDLSIIIPTYNEAENIPELLDRVEASLRNLNAEVIFVDDGSPDGTASLEEELGRRYGNVRVLRRPFKMGLGSAFLDGIKLCESDVVAVMDADLQHPPELLPKMLEKIREGYSLVIASRYVDKGRIESWDLIRRLISKCAIKLAHLLLPGTRRVRDPMSGFFMIEKSLVEGVRLNPRGFKILLEILAKTNPERVAEIPYIFKPRRRGKSKFNIKEIISYLILLVSLRVRANLKIESHD